MQNIKITHVVAVDKNYCIGKDNQLAWHISADLQHFKKITSGGIIVMGRKTYQSLGKPLPNRIHHVISRDDTWQAADGVIISNSLEQAIARAKQDAIKHQKDEIFIIGGGQIYQQSLQLATTLHITFVNTAIDGDAFYPSDLSGFVQQHASDVYHDDSSNLDYQFTVWQKQQ